MKKDKTLTGRPIYTGAGAAAVRMQDPTVLTETRQRRTGFAVYELNTVTAASRPHRRLLPLVSHSDLSSLFQYVRSKVPIHLKHGFLARPHASVHIPNGIWISFTGASSHA